MKKPILSFLIVFAWLYIGFKPAFLHPNKILFGTSGDAIKNYAAFAGHIKNDPTYLVYENMNYPYKVDYIYMDGNFLMGNILKSLKNVSPWFENNSIAIYNWSLLLSIPLCAFFLSLIFLRLRVAGWFNILASVCITLVSPQIIRIAGHTTLAYLCFIPLSLWLFIRFFESERKIKPAIFLSVNLILWYFIHPYLSVIFIFFIVLFFLVKLITVRPYFKIPLSEYLSYFLITAVPILVTAVFMHLTDHHANRPVRPYGFWEGYASFTSVFIPKRMPFGILFTGQFGFPEGNWEGLAYIGLPCALLAVFCVYRLIRYAVRKKWFSFFHPVVPKWLSIASLASLLLLLYAMAFPFRLKMEFLLDWFPIIRQFRAVGRFAWIFYYVFDIFAFYILWQIFRYLRMKKLHTTAFTMVALTGIIMIGEGYYTQIDSVKQLEDRINFFDRKTLPPQYVQLIHAVDSLKKDYQCFLPLPFFNIGTDNYTTWEHDESLRVTNIVNFYCNFPSVACCSARVPLNEGKNVLQVESYNYWKKEIEKDLPSKKNFLVLYTKEELDIVDTYWLSKSKKLWENDRFSLLELSYDNLFSADVETVWMQFDSVKSSLIKITDDCYATKKGVYEYVSFDSLKSKTSKNGKGAFEGSLQYFHSLTEYKKYAFDENTNYLVSYWVRNKEEEDSWYDIITAEKDVENGVEDWTNFYSGVRAKVIQGDWGLVEGYFKPRKINNEVKFFISENKHSKRIICADELLLRPADADVYKILKTDSTGRVTEMIKNNIYFARN